VEAPGEEYLIIGGEDHKTGQVNDQVERWERLETWGKSHFTNLGPVTHWWSGQVFETLDGLALIGPDPSGAENVFIATGDSGMGLTHGTIAGLLLTDLILNRENPWRELYAPSRFPLTALGTVAKEGLNMAGQFTDHLGGGDVADVTEIHPCKGAVVRRGLRMIATYRDQYGNLHEMSAVCPHMGCVVHWNDGESTWDCPCHGSRFSAHGRVLHGPAMGDLAPALPGIKEAANQH
jgi:nitrite reductase/ring-hydroxylating ferredoxin subunit